MTSTRLLLPIALSLSLLTGCGSDGGGDDAELTGCEAYCDRIEVACQGGNAQYTARDQCLAACETFPEGTVADQDGHSVGCRTYHAGAALGDPATHCVHAGPGGDGACGENCEGFCSIVLDTCVDDNEAYTDLDDCLFACEDFADTEPFDSGDVSGDTLACRIYHASVATSDPDTHCEHTQPVSATCN